MAQYLAHAPMGNGCSWSGLASMSGKERRTASEVGLRQPWCANLVTGLERDCCEDLLCRRQNRFLAFQCGRGDSRRTDRTEAWIKGSRALGLALKGDETTGRTNLKETMCNGPDFNLSDRAGGCGPDRCRMNNAKEHLADQRDQRDAQGQHVLAYGLHCQIKKPVWTGSPFIRFDSVLANRMHLCEEIIRKSKMTNICMVMLRHFDQAEGPAIIWAPCHALDDSDRHTIPGDQTDRHR